MKKQINILKNLAKVMSIITIVNEHEKKTLECSLRRENIKLKSQFDELFKILFEENNNLKKLMHENSIKNLRNNIKNILYYNGLDWLLNKDDIENSKETNIYVLFLALIFFKEKDFLYKIYIDKKIIRPHNTLDLLANIFEGDICNLFNWLKKETPFKEIEYFSEAEFLNTDQKNIYNWKKEINIISPNKIIEIRKNLEDIAKDHSLKNYQEYIDFFIFSLYLETCKQKINKKINKFFPNLIATTKPLLNMLPLFINQLQSSNADYLENYIEIFKTIGENHKIEKFGQEFIDAFSFDFNNEIKEKKYKNIFSEKELKYPEYKIKENSIQEKSIVSIALFQTYNEEITNLCENFYNENIETFNSFIELSKQSFTPILSDPEFLLKLS